MDGIGTQTPGTGSEPPFPRPPHRVGDRYALPDMDEMKENYAKFPSVEVHSISDLLSAVRKLDACLPVTDIWYRGLSRCYPLAPKTYTKGYLHFEYVHLHQFRNEAPSRFVNCPHFDDFSGWLMLARHYGLATRILDWTTSPMVALYFALERRADWPSEDSDCRTRSEDAYVWALRPRALNQHTGIGGNVPDSDDVSVSLMAKEAWDQGRTSPDRHRGYHEVVAFAPKSVDSRVVAQKSRMTIHRALQPIESFAWAPEVLHKIVIPAKRRDQLFSDLHALGMSRSMLYPDIEGLASEIRLQQRAASDWWPRPRDAM